MLEPEIDMVECGQLMGNWHSGQGDPVYMVGSLFRDGRDCTDLAEVEAAYELIEGKRNDSFFTKEQEDELYKISIFLNDYLVVRGYNFDA